jgi:Fe-S cluster biogenesis protein NfuA/nitrite reductase/ring-hydroxylating ferredoxin subunit
VEFDAAVAQLETLVETLEREGDERALLLLQLVDAVHRPGIELLARGERDHPLARAVLAMYDLIEVDDPVLRAEEALADVRAYVESHGGELAVLSVDDGVVRVRMSGSCQGCAASEVTLRRGIRQALAEGLPGFREVIAEEPEGPSLIDLLRRPVFADAGGPLEEGLRAVEVDGVPVLLAAVEREVYAFRNACPVDGSPLEGGRLAGTVLVCPWHNCAYDARSGKRVDGEEGEGLAVVPVATGDGALRVAVNVA